MFNFKQLRTPISNKKSYFQIKRDHSIVKIKIADGSHRLLVFTSYFALKITVINISTNTIINHNLHP